MSSYDPRYPQHYPYAQAPAGPYKGQGQYPGGYQMVQAGTVNASPPLFNFSNDRFLNGLLIGAAAAYLLTNESVQRTAIKGAVKLWGGLQGGVEEVKERFRDAEAELQAAAAEKDA